MEWHEMERNQLQESSIGSLPNLISQEDYVPGIWFFIKDYIFSCNFKINYQLEVNLCPVMKIQLLDS